jgi:hypothetical protein
VKAFHFRLDQALRWRATQVDIEKAKVAAAAGLLASIRSDLESRRASLNESARHLAAGSNGAALEYWAAWRDRTGRQIKDLVVNLREAEGALAVQMKLLVEANQRQRLLENLKQTEHARWHVEFGRELEAFASEAFLGRLQSKSGRARSSGG